MKTKKILIMVLASSNPHYKDLEYAIKETWFNFKHPDVEIIFYSDNDFELEKSNDTILDGSNLILPCRDGYYFSGVKTVLAFEWILNNYDFEYVYRSNLGAYVRPEKIVEFLKDKQNENFYCGIIGHDNYHVGYGIDFASGSGYFLSKDLVKKVVDNQYLWPHNSVDDVGLAHVMKELNIPIDKSAKRLNYWYVEDEYKFDYNIGDQFVDTIPDEELYHIRLRSQDRTKDVAKMHELYKKELEKNDK